MADSFTANIIGVTDLVESETNKQRGQGNFTPEGQTGDRIDVLDLPMSDAKLLKLRDEWETQYAPYEGKVAKPIRDRNLRSYLGRNSDNTVPTADDVVAANLQFESEETFLPAATAQDPSPFVFADDTPEGNKISGDVQTMLQFHAQQLLIRRKIAVMVRQWSINHLGVLKAGWEEKISDVSIENRKVQDFVFDPNGYVDVYGDFSSWMGERIYVTAEKLVELFPKASADIIVTVDGKMGTEVCYTEWWTDDYTFSTFKKIVLDKSKNQYFNHEKQEDQQPDPLTGQVQPVKRNHFAYPKKPYIFLSVFSLGERPHDITGLIEQNIPNQNRINRREEQLDGALGQAVNGTGYSENNFNQETAKQASNALKDQRKGQVLIPAGGPIAEAIVRLPAPEVKEGFFKDLDTTKADLRSAWGTQGIASQEAKPDETARGMVLNQGRDTSRIGGGIGDVIEQSVAKSLFDWLVQLYCVFYDEKHFGAVMGSGKATEYVQLSAQSIDRQLIVGVSENSMKPRDQISEMNQAQTAFQAGAIGPKTYLEAINFKDADEAAGDGALYKMSMETDGGRSYIQMNFPELWQQLQGILQQQQQEQQQAQQQELQQQAAAGGQQLQQKQQAGEQQLAQGAQQHQQKISQAAEVHGQKVAQMKDIASAKLASQTKGATTK
jgi:hypothetical protein